MSTLHFKLCLKNGLFKAEYSFWSRYHSSVFSRISSFTPAHYHTTIQISPFHNRDLQVQTRFPCPPSYFSTPFLSRTISFPNNATPNPPPLTAGHELEMAEQVIHSLTLANTPPKIKISMWWARDQKGSEEASDLLRLWLHESWRCRQTQVRNGS